MKNNQKLLAPPTKDHPHFKINPDGSKYAIFMTKDGFTVYILKYKDWPYLI